MAEFDSTTFFWDCQDKGRKRSFLLVLAFLVAVFVTALFFHIIVWLFLMIYSMWRLDLPVELTFKHHLILQVIFMTFMIAVSMRHIRVIKNEGGYYVAALLRARPLLSDKAEPVPGSQEQLLLHVLEEMCLAARLPMPKVFVTTDNSINAMVAGLTPENIVMVVTEGFFKNLNREEMSGVVGHELGHVRNGDLALNIYMIAWLKGLALIHVCGEKLCAPFRESRGTFILLWLSIFGWLLMFLGLVGHFMAGAIQAAFSRTRETMADAASIEFNRGTSGLAGALIKIGGHNQRSIINTDEIMNVRHFFIAKAVDSFWDTHPPLGARIMAIDPAWDGKFEDEAAGADENIPGVIAKVKMTGADVNAYALSGVGTALWAALETAPFYAALPPNVAAPVKNNYLRHFLHQLPDETLTAAQSKAGLAVTLAALLWQHDLAAQAPNLEQEEAYLKQAFGGAWPNVASLAEAFSQLEGVSLLPVVDLAGPAISQLTQEETGRLNAFIAVVIKASGRLDLFKATVNSITKGYAAGQPDAKAPEAKFTGSAPELRDAVEVTLSTLGRLAFPDNGEEAAEMFKRGFAFLQMPLVNSALKDSGQLGVRPLTGALAAVNSSPLPFKRKMLAAICQAACFNQRRLNIQEYELLRAFYAAVRLG